MDTALCTTNKKCYDVASFSVLEDKDLSDFRRSLVCQRCKAKGYYRKASRDGKPACFGAYHKENCEYKTKVSTSIRTTKADCEEEVNAIVVNNQAIDIDFGAREPTHSVSAFRSSFDNNPSASFVSRRHTKEAIKVKNTKKTMSRLLKMLMNTDSFASSDIVVNVDVGQSFKAKNLFVHFDDVSKERESQCLGYWGVIKNADPGIKWLNIGNKKNVSILVSDFKSYILEMCKIESAQELAGASVLVFGKLKISANDKIYIKVNDGHPGHIYIETAS